MKSILLILISLFTCQLFSQELKEKKDLSIIELDDLFNPFTGSFVLIDLTTDEIMVYNDTIASKRYSPCSTFKITNSLISLEAGVANDASYSIEYDSLKVPRKPWWYTTEPLKHWMQDHTMQTAIKYSVVWYYQELARRIGEKDMVRLLNQIDYGNNDITSGIDNFWLCGSLRISAKEQADFIKDLYNKDLIGFSEQSQEIVKNIMLYETTDKFKLYAKTGGGDCWDNKIIGWYVGFVETKSGTYVFAMNMFVESFKDLGDKRIDLTKRILKELEIIE